MASNSIDIADELIEKQVNRFMIEVGLVTSRVVPFYLIQLN